MTWHMSESVNREPSGSLVGTLHIFESQAARQLAKASRIPNSARINRATPQNMGH